MEAALVARTDDPRIFGKPPPDPAQHDSVQRDDQDRRQRCAGCIKVEQDQQYDRADQRGAGRLDQMKNQVDGDVLDLVER